MGPRSIPADRFDYAGAISRSWKEQMLLNMVKIRYAETPVFLDVQQVVQQYTVEGSAAVFAPGWTGDSSITQAAGAAGRWAESPTITYAPLSGERFTKGLLRPVAPADLFSLVQSGWPADAVFEIAVRSINGLHSRSKLEAFKRAGDDDFYRAMAIFRSLQVANSFGMRVEEQKDGQATMLLFRGQQVSEAAAAEALELRRLLRLSPDAQDFKITFGGVPQNDREIAVLTRSMLEILAEASAGVEIPASDVDEGRATKMESLDPVSEHKPRFFVRVHYTEAKPQGFDAFTAIQYRHGWFWVDDRDLPSKRGLSFLMMLFTLVESGTAEKPPSLTISKP